MKNILFAFCLTALLCLTSTHATAQGQMQNSISNLEALFNNSANDIDLPSVSNETSGALPMAYPILNMTQDKSEMITLKNEAASVVVGNPNHISVFLDTPNTLIVVPRKAGASHFSVIGKDGNIIMQRHVVVGAAKENYVRIRRSCNANSGANCQKTSTYFCPGTCHEVQENIQ